jgi:hypothetical protein
LFARLFEPGTRNSVELGIGYAVARQHSTSWHTKHMMMQLLTTRTLLAFIAPLHALTPPKSSHVSPTPSVRRRNLAIRVRGGDNATNALCIRGGTGKKPKKRRKRGARRWPTYSTRRDSRVETPKAAEPVVETPVAKDFNQLKEVPQGWIDRTINFLEAPVTELLIGATAVSLSLMEIQRQIIELGTREADYSVLFLAATRMLKAFLAVLRSTRMALRGYKSYAVIKKGENVYLKKIPATDDDAGVV